MIFQYKSLSLINARHKPFLWKLLHLAVDDLWSSSTLRCYGILQNKAAQRSIDICLCKSCIKCKKGKEKIY